MVIYTSMVFLLGNFLGPIVYFCLVVFGVGFHSSSLVIFSLISNTLQFGSYGLNMFVCYSFNNKYRLILRKIFKRIKQKMNIYLYLYLNIFISFKNKVFCSLFSVYILHVYQWSLGLRSRIFFQFKCRFLCQQKNSFRY